jgi:hypothetical protein
MNLGINIPAAQKKIDQNIDIQKEIRKAANISIFMGQFLQ